MNERAEAAVSVIAGVLLCVLNSCDLCSPCCILTAALFLFIVRIRQFIRLVLDFICGRYGQCTVLLLMRWLVDLPVLWLKYNIGRTTTFRKL